MPKANRNQQSPGWLLIRGKWSQGLYPHPDFCGNINHFFPMIPLPPILSGLLSKGDP